MSDHLESLRSIDFMCDLGYFGYDRRDDLYLEAATNNLSGNKQAIAQGLQEFLHNSRVRNFKANWLTYYMRPGQKPNTKEEFTLLLELKTLNEESDFYDEDVHRDGSFNFSLLEKDRLLALASYEPSRGRFECKQLQGISLDSGPKLAAYRWTDALVAFAENWAHQNGIRVTGVQGAQNNEWVRNNHLPLERAVRIYDQTAERLQYVLTPEGNYQKSLTLE